MHPFYCTHGTHGTPTTYSTYPVVSFKCSKYGRTAELLSWGGVVPVNSQTPICQQSSARTTPPPGLNHNIELDRCTFYGRVDPPFPNIAGVPLQRRETPATVQFQSPVAH